MAAQISRERGGEYLKEALLLLKEKGGKLSSGEVISELEKRLTLNEYERSFNKTGHARWRTHFRFISVALVKAGWVEKDRRVWTLTDKAQGFESMSPIALMDFLDTEYERWRESTRPSEATGEAWAEESDEPDVLMQVKPGDISFLDLMSGVEKCRIQIPAFQRSFVWKPQDIRYLLDSIYRGYPIGSFIFWRTTRKLPRSRMVGDIEFACDDLREGTEIAYVLDGQQRITSLFAAVKGAAIDGEYFRFLFDLRTKTFIVEHASESTEGSRSSEEDMQALRIPIGNLFVETQAEYRRLTQGYPDEYQDILANLHGRFAAYRFSVINVHDELSADEEVQAEGVKQVVRMFSRINETGKKLTVVAKMVARCWGEGFDLREQLNDFYARSPELEHIREETILQAASAILNYRQSRTKNILDDTDIHKLESEWPLIEKAFLAATDFVKTTYHIRDLKYLPFDAVLVPLSYLFYKQRQLNNEQLVQIGHWFWGANLSNRYSATVEAKTEEDCANFDLLLEGGTPVFNFLIDWGSLKERIINHHYNLRNAFVKTILSLYSYARPRNLIDGSEVSIASALSGYYRHQLHHVFPISYIRKSYPELVDKVNSIANIMFIPALTNNHISDRAPSDYISELNAGYPELPGILDRHHYIPGLKESGLMTDEYEVFLNTRAERMVAALRVVTGTIRGTEAIVDTEPVKAVDLTEARLRDVLHQLLGQAHEGSYWNTAVPADIRVATDRKMAEHLRRNPYASLEEYERDDVRLRFLDIMDYCKIVLVNWELFGQYFGNKVDTERHFVAYKNYRNALKHLRSLDTVEQKNGEAALIWIDRVLNSIPS